MKKHRLVFFSLFWAFSLAHAAHRNQRDLEFFKEQAAVNYAKEQSSQWIEKGLSMLPFIAGSVFSKSFMKSENLFMKNAGYLLGGIFSDMMIANTLSKQIMDQVNSAARKATHLLTGSVTEEDKNPTDALFIELESLSIEFEQGKDQLSTDAQELFRRIQNSVRIAKSQRRMMTSMTGDSQANTETLKKQFAPIISIMQTLLELPKQVQPITLDPALKAKLQPIFNRYSATVQRDLKLFTVSSLSNSGSKSVLYLVGEPGTGKTTFTKEFVKTIGLPLIEITDIEKALELKGPLFGFADSINDVFKLSLLTEMLRNQPKNAVLFLDELDKVFNKARNPSNMGMGMPGINLESFLHQLLDPNQKTIKLPDLDINIDISRLIIIAAGNHKLESNSLRNRMTEINFPCIEANKRPFIARARFELRMAQNNLQSTEQDSEIIQKIAALDPYCGVRSLEFTVDDYVNWKVLQQSDWGLESDFNITEIFNNHPSS